MKFYNEYQVNNLHKHSNLNLCKYCCLKFLQVWQKEISHNFDARVSVTLFMKQNNVYIQKWLWEKDV